MTNLQPGLLPGPADLFEALRFAIVAVLTCGLGFLAGARRWETALFAGWGVGCIVLVAVGCLGHARLAPAMAALGVLGAAGLLLRARRGGEDEMAWRVLVLGAPLLAILLSIRTTGYDDFSFWAPNLVALCLTGHFPVAAHPLAASFMPAYPRGVALTGYATWLLGPAPSPAGIIRLLATGPWWNILVMLAASAALANNLAARLGNGRTWFGIAALAILLQTFLNPGFISKMTLTNMGDAATGSGLAMLAALLFELPQAQSRRRVVTEMALTAAAVVFIRQDNLALLGIWGIGAGLGLLLWGGEHRARKIGWLIVTAMPAAAVWAIWTHYAAVQMPGGAHRVLPFSQWHWANYPDTLRSAGRVLLEKGVYTLIAIGFGIGFFMMLAGRGPKAQAQRLLVTATTLLVFGNAAFIMFTYLATSFTPVEVRTAVTFWRFLAQTAPAEMVTLACLAPLSWLGWLRAPRPALGVGLIAAFLPVALLPTPFTFRTDLHFDTPAFLEIGESLARMLPPGAPVTLIDNSDGSGYVAWMIKFGLLELGGTTHDVTISLAPQLHPYRQVSPQSVPAGTYVVVTQSGWRPAWFKNIGMQPWHAYLFKSGNAGLILLKDWQIPRYGRKY